jgi:hypothetical protein
MAFKLKNIIEYFKPLIEKQMDPLTVSKIQDELSQTSGECPRCGEDESNCICVERDSASTVNLYRYKKN